MISEDSPPCKALYSEQPWYVPVLVTQRVPPFERCFSNFSSVPWSILTRVETHSASAFPGPVLDVGAVISGVPE